MALKTTKEIHLRGIPICAGIAIGKPFFFTFMDDVVPEFTIAANELEDEIARFRRALKRSRADIMRLQKQLEAEGALEGAAILDTHLQMMQDPALTTEIEAKVRATRINTESIFQAVIHDYEEKFNRISDKFFRERFKDIQDIYRRIMGHLRDSVRVSLADIPNNSIVFSHELAPTDTAEAKQNCVSAFVTEVGGETSHAAIMARAKGIPYVSNVNFDDLEGAKHSTVIVDGRTGDLILNPSKATLTKYKELQQQLSLHVKSLEDYGGLEAETIDGYRVKLSANVEMLNEIEMIHEYGGSGVGLFRSEYILLSEEGSMLEDGFPSEDEQFQAYCRIVQNMRGLPVVIRTFDVGGDKFNEIEELRKETNPFLGCRAIRFLLKEPEIFRTQIRAIFRASVYGQVKIMFPMISGLPELIEAKQFVEKVKREMIEEGIEIDQDVKIGCMIEVPSAAITCDLLAKESDFLSIGTNDLVQYSLAVDRGNQQMSYLYSPTHPSVIRLIKMVVTEGNRNGIPVSICGEIAADPRFTALLLGLGVRELSVAPRYIPVVKSAIRNTSIVEACHLAEKVFGVPTAKEVYDLLVKEYETSFPNDFFYNH
ncbi:MAG: phosphotransferase system enzyme I (PtsI) [Chlamydiales bacterium]|jgi:phosphotransferase system enzyme I (PtsI)